VSLGAEWDLQGFQKPRQMERADRPWAKEEAWLPEPAASPIDGEFSDHFLVETDPSSDPAIAEALGFEAQNDSVARGDVGYRILCGSKPRPDQGIQSSPVQALLKTA